MGVATAVLIILGILIATGLIVLFVVLEQQRLRRFRAWADDNGWSYTESDRNQRPVALRSFTPFNQGSARHARHILAQRVEGTNLEVFEYRFTTQSGKHTQVHIYTIATAAMPIDGHGLVIQREHVGHKVLDALGAEDIDFEDDAFSRAFWVQGQDRRFAYDVLHPPMMDFLMQSGTDWVWQWRGRILLIHRGGGLNEAKVQVAANALTGFVRALPRHRLAEVKHARK